MLSLSGTKLEKWAKKPVPMDRHILCHKLLFLSRAHVTVQTDCPIYLQSLEAQSGQSPVVSDGRTLKTSVERTTHIAIG